MPLSSKSILEVWDWKDKVQAEGPALSDKDYVQQSKEAADKILRKNCIRLHKLSSPFVNSSSLRVAEEPREYPDTTGKDL
jgi:hypothetical protein